MSTRRLRLFRELPVSSTKQEKQNYAFHRGEEIKSPHWTVVVSPQQPSEKFPFYFDRSIAERPKDESWACGHVSAFLRIPEDFSEGPIAASELSSTTCIARRHHSSCLAHWRNWDAALPRLTLKLYRATSSPWLRVEKLASGHPQWDVVASGLEFHSGRKGLHVGIRGSTIFLESTRRRNSLSWLVGKYSWSGTILWTLLERQCAGCQNMNVVAGSIDSSRQATKSSCTQRWQTGAALSIFNF